MTSVFDVKAGGDLANGICQTAADNNVCTLRAAIMKANHYPGGGVTINIPAGKYTIGIPAIAPDDESTGNLNLVQTMTIAGAGMDSTQIDGANIGSVMVVEAPNTSISGLTIQNGKATGGKGGGLRATASGLTLNKVRFRNNKAQVGGGLSLNGGNATVNDCVIADNLGESTTAASFGGGVFVSASAVFNRNLITDNKATDSGGGVYMSLDKVGDSAFIVVLNDTTVAGNESAQGGGLLTRPRVELVLNRSLVHSNRATNSAGGIWASGNATLALNNSTVSANVAGSGGGGIHNLGQTNAFHSTVAGNIANASGTGGAGAGVLNDGTFSVWNSLFTENYAGIFPGDTDGTQLVSYDYNFMGRTYSYNGTDTNHVTTGNPLLGPLKNNGGATSTHALLAGSNSLDRIPANLCRDSFGVAPTTDQRGVQRPAGGLCDIGAFEGVQPLPLFNANIIRNGDAEAGGGTQNGFFIERPYWTWVQGAPTVIRYNAPGGYPTVGIDIVPPVHGYNFFSGGNQIFSVTKQSVVVTAAGGAIDAGAVKFTLSGDFGGFLTDNDAAQLRALFRDVNGAQIGNAVDVGGHDAVFRANKTGLFPASTTGTVPFGTRTIELNLRFTRASGASNDGYADNLSMVLTRSSLDVDGNGTYDALTDGLLIIRYLFGLRGDSLITGAIGPGAARSTAADIVLYLDAIQPGLDVDGNTQDDALTDGLILLRYLFGLRGTSLVAGAIGAGATRQTPSAVETYVATLLP